MKQDNDQKILNYLSQLKSKTKQQKRFECTKLVDYTIELVFFMLVVGVAELVPIAGGSIEGREFKFV